MSKIIKELKNATFIYDEDSKEFTIKAAPFGKTDGGYAIGGNSLKLNKVYAFAFMRFVVRMAQRNWLRSNKSISKIIEEEELEEENPNQLNLF